MQEKPKVRIKSLSTRFLNLYKASGYVMIVGLGVLVFYFLFQERNGDDYFGMLFRSGYVAWLGYLWWKLNSNVRRVEFDDEFLYVILQKQDIVIPLENIKDINLKTLGGVYRVDFYHPEQLGEKIYFKPSLLYPFNSKKKDELVNVLWSNIEKAKRKVQNFQRNALRS